MLSGLGITHYTLFKPNILWKHPVNEFFTNLLTHLYKRVLSPTRGFVGCPKCAIAATQTRQTLSTRASTQTFGIFQAVPLVILSLLIKLLCAVISLHFICRVSLPGPHPWSTTAQRPTPNSIKRFFRNQNAVGWVREFDVHAWWQRPFSISSRLTHWWSFVLRTSSSSSSQREVTSLSIHHTCRSFRLSASSASLSLSKRGGTRKIQSRIDDGFTG